MERQGKAEVAELLRALPERYVQALRLHLAL
jgi:hypothetical protein